MSFVGPASACSSLCKALNISSSLSSGCLPSLERFLQLGVTGFSQSSTSSSHPPPVAIMLRLKPTVITLTMAEVTGAGHRRRFRRYLEADGVSIPHGVTEDEQPDTLSSHSNASSGALGRALRPQADSFPPDTSSQAPQELLKDVLRAWRDVARVEKGTNAILEEIATKYDNDDLLGEVLNVWNKEARNKTRHNGSCELQDDSSILEEIAALALDSDSPGELEESAPSTPMPRSALRPYYAQRGSIVEEGIPSNETLPSTPRRFSASGSPTEAINTPVISSQISHGPAPPPLLRGSLLQIYNDSLPAAIQPQTPQNLPEARHQSRLHGSYTAPPRRRSPQPTWTPMASRRRRVLGREPSPLGLRTPGFMGLYGGIENMDDAILYEEAIRRSDSRSPLAWQSD